MPSRRASEKFNAGQLEVQIKLFGKRNENEARIGFVDFRPV